jgi:glucose-1-phosphate thymidylyltransferase
MKAIVPAAGQGTRLYPQTHTTPKPMIRLAGKPILGHILDSLVDADITDVVVVVGSMKEQVTGYVSERYADIDVTFVEQETAEGLGHAIYQAVDVAYGDDLFIVLGDMLFENDYEEFLEVHRSFGYVDGSIGTKAVREPQHYGIVTLGVDGRVADLEEKPDEPKSDKAISGAYIVKDSAALFDELEHLVENDVRGSGDEYQLTDALDRMVQSGADFRTFAVGEWYDCGRPETLLEANRALLAQDGCSDVEAADSVLIPPVDIGDDVTLTDSVVGPNVSVDDSAIIQHSIVSDSIIGVRSELVDVNLTESIIGANTRVTGQPKRLNVGDSSDINL